MVLNESNINSFLNKYILFVDEISSLYNYSDNISHLLYLVVPAFVFKYDLTNESTVLRVFKEVRIVINDKEDKVVTATFNRELHKIDNSFVTSKLIVLNQYKDASLTDLIDSIVHEYNHAINSINNEISFDDEVVKMRAGLGYFVYDKKDLHYLYKTNVYLEEVINTEQTEEIINIINSFNKYKIYNINFSNMLFALKNEIKTESYVSKAYYFQSYICDLLMKNKTFTPTITNLRFKGFIDEIPNLFDSVLGKSNSYKKLNLLLEEIYNLEIKYSKAKLFKKRILRRLQSKADDVTKLIKEYDSKCIYK